MSKNSIEQAGYELTGLMMARGAITIIFGIIALVWPGISLVSLAVITAIWLFLSGVTGAISSIFMRDNYEHWFLRLLVSVVQFGVGAYLVQRPDITVATFVLILSISFIVEGVIDMAMAFSDEAVDSGTRTIGIITGLLTIGGGVIIWRYPVSGTLAFVWVLGLLALIKGTMLLWFAIDTRSKLKA